MYQKNMHKTIMRNIFKHIKAPLTTVVVRWQGSGDKVVMRWRWGGGDMTVRCGRDSDENARRLVSTNIVCRSLLRMFLSDIMASLLQSIIFIYKDIETYSYQHVYVYNCECRAKHSTIVVRFRNKTLAYTKTRY